MRKLVALLALVSSLLSFAADYSLDFTGATPLSADAPVLRKAEISVAVGQIPSVAVGDTISLKLFADVDFELKIVSAPPAGIAGQSFIARDQNGSASAIVKVKDGSARIFVDDFMNLRQYTVRCKDGKALIVERDNSQVEEGECATCAGEVDSEVEDSSDKVRTRAKTKLLSTSPNQGAFDIAMHTNIVDVLVIFDKRAKKWAKDSWSNEAWKDEGTIQEFADYALNKMNMVLERSQLNHLFGYRLCGVEEIDAYYTDVNDALPDLSQSTGGLTKAAAWKKKYGADTTTILIDRTAVRPNGTVSNGAGYELKSLTDETKIRDFAYKNNWACNACDIKTVDSRYTMSHETGHNMGCGHSNKQYESNPVPANEPYSFGYHFFDTNNVPRATIMAYTYTTPRDGNDYKLIPYFSSPDITPPEYGVPVGTLTNDNRKVLTISHSIVSEWQEHVKPYDWDVRFLDDNGNDIHDGSYFPGYYYVTMAHENPNAVIYYTYNNQAPTSESAFCSPGTHFTMSGSKTITACAVVGGVSQSVRTISFKYGLTWSGDSNGDGLWLSGDSSVRPWGGEYFYNGDAVRFDDLAGISSATVTVKGVVAPGSVLFSALSTAYTFSDKGDGDAKITIPDANFAPAGDVTFNVPVQLAATTFTNMNGNVLTFNAPFGQTVDATSGYCTNMIGIGENGILTVAPGAGKTQNLEKLNNIGWYAGSSTFRVGEGTVVFNGVLNNNNKGAGVIGRTKLEVGNGGNLIFNMGGGTGYEMNQTSLTVEKGGSVTFNEMEHTRRNLILNGGTINCKTRWDLMYSPSVTVTDDSVAEDIGSAYLQFRYGNVSVNVSNGKTFTINIPIQPKDGNTSGYGIIKTGGGTIVANKEIKHSGATTIQAGGLTVGYSATGRYGTGWSVANGAKLKINSGCSLSVPNLTLTSGATLSVPISSSAPLTATNAVSVAGVAFELTGMEGTSNAIYPLLHADGGITGVESIDTSRLPALSGGSEWSLEVKDNTLYARSFTIAPAEGTVPLVSNVSGISIVMPEDAKVDAGGGAVVEASPIVLEPLKTEKITVIAKIRIPAGELSEASTICSLKAGSCAIYCVRDTDGTLDCRWIDGDGQLKTVKKEIGGKQLLAGEHVLQIEYFDGADGTKVFVDGALVYKASALRFTGSTVSRVSFGATAENSPLFVYPGLVVREAIVIDTADNSKDSKLPAILVSGRLPTVDVLVAYDSGAQTYVSNKCEKLELFAQTQIDRMNAVLATNRLDRYYSYRLAGVCKVDGTYNDINTAPATISEGTGAAVSLRAAREHYGADTVTLLVNTTGNTLGNSSPLSYTTGVANQHENAFSVCSISAVDTGKQHTMIHENAHNMGCGHARAHDHCSPFDYGYGFYFTNGNNVTRHTIMAYGTDANASWYFSTSSSEFGLTLGDATNDNARVLRETCGEVAKWRESVLPYGDDVIVKVAGSGEEVLPGRVFANSIKLELSAPDGVEDATIYYTLDGSAPTLESSIYSSPFEVTETTLLLLRYVSGTTVSPVRTVKLFRIDALADAGDVTWYTSVKYPWADDGDGVVRSCNHTNYNYYCTTPLRAKVVGPKKLRFKQKSYFFSPNEDSNYSHFDVLVDDKVARATNYCDTAWIGDVEISIQGEGEHDIQFVYSQRNAMNNPGHYKGGTPEMDDAVWLKDIRFLDPTTYEVREGETIAYSALPEGTTRFVGKGTVNCGATLPDAKYGFTNDTWKGTVVFSGVAGASSFYNFMFENYGNANSRIELKNCHIPYLLNNNGCFAGTLVLTDDGVNPAFKTTNGYSDYYNVVGALEGDGDMSFENGQRQSCVFNVATNYTGSIYIDAKNNNGTIGGRRIVFGNVSSASDLPMQSATVTIKSGATASIGGGATWYAYNGVEIAGTLIVKGAGATLDCNDSGALGIKLDGGATIRFESNDANVVFAKTFKFDSGTVNIELGDGVTPTNRKLIDWPSKPTGNFNLVGYDGKWVLAVEDDGLSLAKWKPNEDKRYDIPGTDAYIAESDALSDWLDWNNFELYEFWGGTWQEFMGESGKNSYLNWQNFLLGYSAEDPTQKFKAKIEIVNGEVKITTTEGNIPDGYGVVKRLFKKSSLDADWDPPEGEIMSGKSQTIDAGEGGFFKVVVGIEQE